MDEASHVAVAGGAAGYEKQQQQQQQQQEASKSKSSNNANNKNRYAHLVAGQRIPGGQVRVELDSAHTGTGRDSYTRKPYHEQQVPEQRASAAPPNGEPYNGKQQQQPQQQQQQRKGPPLASQMGHQYYASLSSFDWHLQWTMFKGRLMERANEPAGQRKLIMIIVCCALLLDNMLYMVIVPIIPDYLRSIGSWSTYAEGADWKPVNHLTSSGAAVTGNRSSLTNNNNNNHHWNRTQSTTSTSTTATSNRERVKWVQVSGRLVYEGEDSAVGFLFASKAIVQLFINPFSGAIIDRIGYEMPMMIGLIVMFLSTMVFACGQTYTVLFLARSLQGVGSAFADTSGLAMIADRFTEENERQRALGIALAFISFGCLVAPPFGSILYEVAGKEVPFIILSLVCLLDGSLLLMVTPKGTFRRTLGRLLGAPEAATSSLVGPPPPPPLSAQDKQTGNHKLTEPPIKQLSISRRESMAASNHNKQPEGTPIYVLLRDPCIACCAGSLVVANVSLAFLEPTISIWMHDTMSDIEEWQLGMIWFPAFVPHVLGVYCTVKLNKKYPQHQWIIAALGLFLEGLSCLLVPFCSSFWSLIIPISLICFGLALIDTAILPTLGYLVDTRYVSVYGSIYAIADISYSLSYAVGPILAGGIVEAIGFSALNLLIAFVTCCYAPLLIMLRNIRDYDPFVGAAASGSINQPNGSSTPPPPPDATVSTTCQPRQPLDQTKQVASCRQDNTPAWSSVARKDGAPEAARLSKNPFVVEAATSGN